MHMTTQPSSGVGSAQAITALKSAYGLDWTLCNKSEGDEYTLWLVKAGDLRVEARCSNPLIPKDLSYNYYLVGLPGGAFYLASDIKHFDFIVEKTKHQT